jgi:4'-phosphopantetheinyl transferase
MPAAPSPSPPVPRSAHDSWASGPLRPELSEGVVDVWRADLTAVEDAMCDELLSDDERARAQRMRSERSRRLWSRSRGVLRALLGRYLDMDPAALRFATAARGKPALLERTPRAGVTRAELASKSTLPPQFNLSHSDGIALYAIAAGPSLGIDVEVDRRPIDEVAIAARTFGAAEASRLRALDAGTCRREFLQAWVRHEARLKCLGVGIGWQRTADLGGVRIPADIEVSDAPRPWIADLGVGPRAAGAVAVDVAPRALRCWDWSA